MRARFVLAILAVLWIARAASGDPFEDSGYIGMNVSYRDEPALGEGRMTVEKVYPGSPAASAGLAQGDVLTRVNGAAFRFADWTATMENGGPLTWVAAGDRVRLGLLRSGKPVEITLIAVAPPADVVAARRSLKTKLLLQRGTQVFDRLSRQNALVQVEKKAGESGLRASVPGLPEADAEALGLYLSTSRLRTLFVDLAPGGTLGLKLGIHPGTSDPSIEIVRP